MKTKLNNLVANIENVSLEEIISFFEETEDILILKFDGVRKSDKYSVIILGKESRFDAIRFEGGHLKNCLTLALNAYLKII